MDTKFAYGSIGLESQLLNKILVPDPRVPTAELRVTVCDLRTGPELNIFGIIPGYSRFWSILFRSYSSIISSSVYLPIFKR